VTRDLLVLDAIVRYFAEHDDAFPDVRDLAAITGLRPADVYKACRALNGIYIDFTMLMTGGDPNPHFVAGVHPAARQVVGQWPTGEEWVSRLVVALTEAADNEPNEERRPKLRATAQLLGGIAKEIIVQVIATKTGTIIPG
jgi:hypothetical protein